MRLFVASLQDGGGAPPGCTPSPEAVAVLSRYTGLTDRETFAICRFVNACVLDGNLALMDEVFLSGLYTEANALTGMVSSLGVNNGATHIAGGGFVYDGVAAYVDSGFKLTPSGVATIADNVSGIILNEFNYGGSVESFYGTRTDINTTDFIHPNQQDSVGIRLAPLCVRSPISSAHSFKKNELFTMSNVLGANVVFYVNGALINTSNSTQLSPNFPDHNFFIGARNSGTAATNFVNARISSLFVGNSNGFNNAAWSTNLWQCQNELEIGKADLIDYNVQDKLYDWSNRSLLESQLDELSQIIVDNSDAVTTGRSFNIVGNLGISTQAQANLDTLVANGWVIIQ